MDKVKLLPCDWCGKVPSIVCPDNSYGEALVTCGDANECPVDVTASADLDKGETIDDAIARWNTRTRPPIGTDEVVERVVREQFQIGDEVAVIPGCDDWASDWRDVRLWIAGVNAVPNGGFEYCVSDAWPLPEKPALTDGFYMGVKDEPDTLALVARAAIAAMPAIDQDGGENV